MVAPGHRLGGSGPLHPRPRACSVATPHSPSRARFLSFIGRPAWFADESHAVCRFCCSTPSASWVGLSRSLGCLVGEAGAWSRPLGTVSAVAVGGLAVAGLVLLHRKRHRLVLAPADPGPDAVGSADEADAAAPVVDGSSRAEA